MKTKKFKIWVAVDEDGEVDIFRKEKPEFNPQTKIWNNQSCEYLYLGLDKELKAGKDSLLELVFELPLKGGEIKDIGDCLYVAVDKDLSVWVFSEEPHFDGSQWRSTGVSKFVGFTDDCIDAAKSLCKTRFGVPYKIINEL